MKFTENKLEQTFIDLLAQEGYQHHLGIEIARSLDEVLIIDDLKSFLSSKYAAQGISETEIKTIILQLKSLSSSDLYDSNRAFQNMLSDGFILKREDRSQKDLYIQLIDYTGLESQRQHPEQFVTTIAAEPNPQYSSDRNIYKFVTQLEILGTEKRIPDGILYVNGLPLVVFEFKSAIREEATVHNAFEQITKRYRRDIPELFKYNCFCILSDGANNKAGSFFAPYEFFYGWRRIAGLKKEVDGVDSLFTLVQGMLHRNRLRDIVRNFIFVHCMTT
jgi:type I restriction enzyme R subunit